MQEPASLSRCVDPSYIQPIKDGEYALSWFAAAQPCGALIIKTAENTGGFNGSHKIENHGTSSLS